MASVSNILISIKQGLALTRRGRYLWQDWVIGLKPKPSPIISLSGLGLDITLVIHNVLQEKNIGIGSWSPFGQSQGTHFESCGQGSLGPVLFGLGLKLRFSTQVVSVSKI